METGDGEAKLSLEADTYHMNTLNMLHGGVHATLLDNAMGLAARSIFKHSVVTTHLNIVFLNNVSHGTVYAYGKVVHRTKRTATVEGRVTDEHGMPIAMATGSFLHKNVSEGKEEGG